jgi:TPR repeat protein
MQLLHDGVRLSCAHCKGILGGCYLFGEGVETDVARGRELLKDSIDAGSAHGQYTPPPPLTNSPFFRINLTC